MKFTRDQIQYGTQVSNGRTHWEVIRIWQNLRKGNIWVKLKAHHEVTNGKSEIDRPFNTFFDVINKPDTCFNFVLYEIY